MFVPEHFISCYIMIADYHITLKNTSSIPAQMTIILLYMYIVLYETRSRGESEKVLSASLLLYT